MEWRKVHENTEKNMELYIDTCTWYDGHDYNYLLFSGEIAGGREMLYTAESNYDCFDVMRVLAGSIDNSGMSVRKAD